MKKLFGILLVLQVALLFLLTVPSQAQARWGDDSYRDSYKEQRNEYRHPGIERGSHDWDNQSNILSTWGAFHMAPFLRMGSFDDRSLAFASLYKLCVDVALSILFITFFSKLIMRVFTRMKAHPFKNGYVGFTFLIIFPLISIILLGLLWLGVAGFLTYGLIFLTGLFLAKVFIGWAILRKLEKGYVLDWKAGLAGPLVVFILLFIPVLGWIAVAVIMSMATGAFLIELVPLLERQKQENHKSKITNR